MVSSVPSGAVCRRSVKLERSASQLMTPPLESVE